MKDESRKVEDEVEISPFRLLCPFASSVARSERLLQGQRSLEWNSATFATFA